MEVMEGQDPCAGNDDKRANSRTSGKQVAGEMRCEGDARAVLLYLYEGCKARH